MMILVFDGYKMLYNEK